MTKAIFSSLLKNQVVVGGIFFLGLWLLFSVKEIIIDIFIAYIIMAALYPMVAYLKSKKFPNILAVLIPYFFYISLGALLLVSLIPFFISQVQILIENFPVYLEKAASIFNINVDYSQLDSVIVSEMDTIGKNALSFSTGIFSGFFSFLTILVISFYLLLDHERIKKGLANFFQFSSQKETLDIFSQIEEKLGAWLRGQIILSVSIGIPIWIALTLVGIEVALPLAIIAGILEVVPTIGPILAAVPAVIIALTISPTTALIVIAIYAIVQMLENNILVPKIMEKAVGLNPIVIIVIVMVGAKLLGVLGALLSIPFLSLLLIIYKNLRNYSSSK